MSVDQVGSKDSDATVTVAGISSRPVSVDQVGSKDSDRREERRGEHPDCVR